MKRLTADITDEDYMEFKAFALWKGITMRSLATLAIKDFIAQEKTWDSSILKGLKNE